MDLSNPDPDAWFACFMELATRPSLRRRAIARGLAAANRFSWGASAERYLQAMAAMDGVQYSPMTAPAPQRDRSAPRRAGSAPTPSIEAINSRYVSATRRHV